jgi:hypothetical protein
MALFKLVPKGDDIDNAELVEATKTSLDLERHLESWLEQSPWAIAQEPLLDNRQADYSRARRKKRFP